MLSCDPMICICQRKQCNHSHMGATLSYKRKYQVFHQKTEIFSFMKWTLLVPVITIECKLCINRLRFRYYVCVRRWPILWHQFRRTLFIRVIPFNFYPSAIWSEYAILFWCLPLLQIFQIVIIVSIRIALQKKTPMTESMKI